MIAPIRNLCSLSTIFAAVACIIAITFTAATASELDNKTISTGQTSTADNSTRVSRCRGNAAETFKVDVCSNNECTLDIYKVYRSNITFMARTNNAFLTLNITANNETIWKTSFWEINAGKNYSKTYYVPFGSQFENSTTYEEQVIQVILQEEKGNETEIEECAMFEVKLNNSFPDSNSGTNYGESCGTVDAICNFANSICTETGNQNRCLCDGNSVKHNITNQPIKCLRRAGVACLFQADCMTKTGCNDGICQCYSGKANTAKDKCTNGTRAMSLSSLLFAFQIMLVYLANYK